MCALRCLSTSFLPGQGQETAALLAKMHCTHSLQDCPAPAAPGHRDRLKGALAKAYSKGKATEVDPRGEWGEKGEESYDICLGI